MRTLQLRQIGPPDPGRGHAVADQVLTEKSLIVPRQIGPQTGDLAGGPCEQHRRPPLQQRLGLTIDVPHGALGILGALKPFQLRHILYPAVVHQEGLVKDRAEYHPAALQHALRQQGGASAGGAPLQQFPVQGVQGVGLRYVPLHRDRPRSRTNPSAQTAVGTGCGIYFGVQKPLFIRLHGDTAGRTAIRTGPAARAPLLFHWRLHISLPSFSVSTVFSARQCRAPARSGPS